MTLGWRCDSSVEHCYSREEILCLTPSNRKMYGRLFAVKMIKNSEKSQMVWWSNQIKQTVLKELMDFFLLQSRKSETICPWQSCMLFCEFYFLSFFFFLVKNSVFYMTGGQWQKATMDPTDFVQLCTSYHG